MKPLLKHMRYFWFKYEFVRAGVYASLGAVISVYCAQNLEQYKRLFCHTTHAAEYPINKNFYSQPPFPPPPPPTSSIMQSVGCPQSSQLKIYDGFICSFDRRNRIPYWVMEHLHPDKISSMENDPKHKVQRSNFLFYEDPQEHPLFRSTNKDYLHSGYDRGHMAAAGNHPYEHNAMKETFVLSNIAPQIGDGFNRDSWNDLEKYIRSIARKTANMVVITGPLFLPQQTNNKKFISYEVIGLNNVAVPTHFFKAAAIQSKAGGTWQIRAWVMPNQKLPENVQIAQFQVPIEAVERASGLKLFPRLS